TVERINELMGIKIPFINIVGGGTKEAPLCQLASDSCGIPVYAGPVEATAIGNLMTQAIASGEVKDMAQAREVVRNSFEIDHYEPKKSADWDDGYDRFLKLIEK
nr:rhamnulokinase [Clostridia bacterium]